MADIGSVAPQPSLTLTLFGPFQVCLDGKPLTGLRSRAGRGLLVLLTLNHPRAVERPWLAALLWPDSPESKAFANLRNCLKDLRSVLGREAHRLRSPTPRTLALDLAGAVVDVLAFDAAVARGDPTSLTEAVALYQGPLLKGWVEEWAFEERQVREEACLQALEVLAVQALARGDPRGAEQFLRRAVAVDPLRENAQRALMQSLAADGSYAAATRVYWDLGNLLHREMNVKPDPQTEALYQQLRAEARARTASSAKSGRLAIAARPVGDRSADEVSDAEPFLTREPPGSRELPSGTVTFLFTDIEASTQFWEEQPEAMRTALAHHEALLREAIEAHGGVVFKTAGNQLWAAFRAAPDALAAAIAAQPTLATAGEEATRSVGPLAEAGTSLPGPKVRMALHTGTAEARDGDYAGPPLNRVARLLEAGHGGQILLSRTTQELARDQLPEGAGLRDL